MGTDTDIREEFSGTVSGSEVLLEFSESVAANDKYLDKDMGDR